MLFNCKSKIFIVKSIFLFIDLFDNILTFIEEDFLFLIVVFEILDG